MGEYLVPLLLLAVLFVGFGLTHGNGKGEDSCSGCSCSDPAACGNDKAGVDAAPKR